MFSPSSFIGVFLSPDANFLPFLASMLADREDF
jgi:hypothetical protein